MSDLRRMSWKKTAVIGAVWLLVFIAITIASVDYGNAGEDHWGMYWGYPHWIGIWGEGEFQFSGGNQWELMRKHLPRGEWGFSGVTLCLAAAVAFTPFVLCLSVLSVRKNGFRFELSTLFVLVVATGIAMSIASIEIAGVDSWSTPSPFYYWMLITTALPYLCMALRVCYWILFIRDWIWPRRNDVSRS